MSQSLRDQASNSDEVVTSRMLDGTYLSRNCATSGPTWSQPPRQVLMSVTCLSSGCDPWTKLCSASAREAVQHPENRRISVRKVLADFVRGTSSGALNWAYGRKTWQSQCGTCRSCRGTCSHPKYSGWILKFSKFLQKSLKKTCPTQEVRKWNLGALEI